MPPLTLFLVFCIVGLSQSCMPTRPPDPGIPVTRSPMNPDPEAATRPGTITEAPVTQVPVTEAPVTEAPVTEAPVTEAPVTEAPITEAPVTDAPVTEAPVTEAPLCTTCKASDLVLYDFIWARPYKTGEITLVDGCNHFNGICDVGTDICDGPVQSYIVDGNGDTLLQDLGEFRAAIHYYCKDDGLWYGTDVSNIEGQVIKYLCLQNNCIGVI